MEGLSPLASTGLSFSIEMLNAQLQRLAALGQQVLVVLPHADLLYSDTAEVKEVEGVLAGMLKTVPKLKIILTLTQHADACLAAGECPKTI